MKSLRAIVLLIILGGMSSLCASQTKPTAAEQLSVQKALNEQKKLLEAVSKFESGQEPTKNQIDAFNKQQDIVNKSINKPTMRATIVDPWEQGLPQYLVKARSMLMQKIALSSKELGAGRLPVETTTTTLTLKQKPKVNIEMTEQFIPSKPKIIPNITIEEQFIPNQTKIIPNTSPIAIEKPAVATSGSKLAVTAKSLSEISGELIYDAKSGMLKSDGIKRLIEDIRKNNPGIKTIKLIVTVYNQAAGILQTLNKVKTLDKKMSDALMLMIHDQVVPKIGQLAPIGLGPLSSDLLVKNLTPQDLQAQLAKAPKQGIAGKSQQQTVNVQLIQEAPAVALSPAQEALFQKVKGGIEALSQFVQKSAQEPMAQFSIRQEWFNEALKIALNGVPLTADNVASIQDDLAAAADKLVKELLRKDRVISADQWAKITPSIKKQVTDFMVMQPQEKVIKKVTSGTLNKSAFEAFVKQSEKDTTLWCDNALNIKSEWIDKAMRLYLGDVPMDKSNLSILVKDIPDAASNLMIDYARKGEDYDPVLDDAYIEMGAVADMQVDQYIRKKYAELDHRQVVLPSLK